MSASAQQAASISADSSAKLSSVKACWLVLHVRARWHQQAGVCGKGVAYRVVHALDFLVRVHKA